MTLGLAGDPAGLFPWISGLTCGLALAVLMVSAEVDRKRWRPWVMGCFWAYFCTRPLVVMLSLAGQNGSPTIGPAVGLWCLALLAFDRTSRRLERDAKERVLRPAIAVAGVGDLVLWDLGATLLLMILPACSNLATPAHLWLLSLTNLLVACAQRRALRAVSPPLPKPPGWNPRGHLWILYPVALLALFGHPVTLMVLALTIGLLNAYLVVLDSFAERQVELRLLAAAVIVAVLRLSSLGQLWRTEIVPLPGLESLPETPVLLGFILLLLLTGLPLAAIGWNLDHCEVQAEWPAWRAWERDASVLNWLRRRFVACDQLVYTLACLLLLGRGASVVATIPVMAVGLLAFLPVARMELVRLDQPEMEALD
ncbi:MAG: hypothetical protein KC910_08670 [Candidatus Eremiobacteraeota bacterium]|nr:hypothetical protein [Candidatus Eremiobacteraeota bacterium]